MTRSKRSVLLLEREAEAQVLGQRLRELADDEFVAIARLLVSKPEHQILADTEFELRDIVLRVGAKALQEHLCQKKDFNMVVHRLSLMGSCCRMDGLNESRPRATPAMPVAWNAAVRRGRLRIIWSGASFDLTALCPY